MKHALRFSVLLLTLLLCLPSVRAAEITDYASTTVIEEVSSSEAFAGEVYTARTPADEENVLYVEGRTLQPVKLFAIRLLTRPVGAEETTIVLQTFVRPDENGEFSLKIDTSAGNTEPPAILDGKGTIVPPDETSSSTPGTQEVPRMEPGLYRLSITAAMTDEEANVAPGSSWWTGVLGGVYGSAWKGAVLQVSGSDNNPRLVRFDNVTARRAALQEPLEPNETTIDSYPGSYVRYMDPYAEDLSSVLKNPDTGADEPLTGEQVAYIAEVAEEITAGAESDYEKLVKIYEYVASSFYYNFYDLQTEEHQHCNPFYNLYALREGFEVSNGADGKVATVCDGYASMVITLARAEGIPARLISGFALGGLSTNATWGNTVPETESNHLWAEAWVDGRWVIIDANRGSQNRWERESADDPGTWIYREEISYEGFDISEESFSTSNLVLDTRGGSTEGKFLADAKEFAALRTFLNIRDAADTSNGAKLNDGYDDTAPGTWGGGENKFFTDGYGRTREISWNSKELAGNADFSDFSALRWLTLYTNKLTALVLEGCEELYYLNANYNDLTSIDTTDSPALETLSLKGNELTDAVFLHKGDPITVRGEHGSFSLIYQKTDAEPPLTLYVGKAAEEGYVYEGIYDSSNCLLSADVEYTFNPTDTEYTVRFRDNRAERLPSPEVSVSNTTTGNVQLDWTAVEGATHYTVHRADSADGPFTLLKTTENAEQTSLVNTSLSLGETRYYQVRAVAPDPDKTSMPSAAVVGTRILGRPAPSSAVDDASGKIVLTWSAVEGADRYAILRATAETGTYTTLGTTADLTYTDTSAVPGTAYWYKLRSLSDSNTALTSIDSFTVSRTCKPGQPYVAGIINDDGKPVLTWTAVEGAEKYAVYLEADGTLTWTAYATEPTYTYTKAEAGTTYVFTVRAVTGDIWGAHSAPCTLTCPEGFYVTTQPTSQTAEVGNTAIFSVNVIGRGLTYQWEYRKSDTAEWTPTTFAGNKTAKLTVTVKDYHNGYQYRCKITNGNGEVLYSSTAVLTVKKVSTLAITSQPADKAVAVGKPATFTVKAEGEGTLTYRWQYRKSSSASWASTTFSGYKTDTLTVTPKATHNGYQYCCKITDGNGNVVYSSPATLTVSPLAVSTQPADKAVAVDKPATFSVKAAGEGTLTYRWQYRKSSSASWASTTFSGYKTDTLTVTPKTTHNGYQYRCKITDSTGAVVYSSPATLTVSPLDISTQPKSKTVAVGQKTSFTLKAAGEGTLTYRWQYRKSSSASWAATTFSGYKTNTLTITPKATHNGYQYRCKITDSTGAVVYSSPVTLTVKTLSITTQPKRQTVSVGEKANFTVKASGSGLTYQWQYRKPGGSWAATTFTGNKTDTLTVTAKTSNNGYQYRCVITDGGKNTVTSGYATLRIT